MSEALPFALEAADLALLDRLLAWWMRPGTPWTGDDPEVHRARLAFDLWMGRSFGQSATYHDWYGRLAGWCAWVRTDDEGLELLRTYHLNELVQRRLYLTVHEGPHVYVMDAVVAPNAPKRVYRNLYRIVRRRCADALTVSGHLCKRDGRKCFHIRRIDGGLIGHELLRAEPV